MKKTILLLCTIVIVLLPITSVYAGYSQTARNTQICKTESGIIYGGSCANSKI